MTESRDGLNFAVEGFEVGERYDTMGLRANDLRRITYNDVRVPADAGAIARNDGICSGTRADGRARRPALRLHSRIRALR